MAWLAAFLLRMLLFLYRLTLKFRFIPGNQFETLPPRSLVAILHGSQFYFIALRPTCDFMIPVSLSRDGEIIAHMIRWCGWKTARGSSSRGGQEVSHAMVAHLSAGGVAGIAIDGPRGPKGVAKPGIVSIARKSRATIVPVVSTCTSHWSLRSWDCFEIPRPWSTVTFSFTSPIHVADTLTPGEFEAVRKSVEVSLTHESTAGGWSCAS